MWGYILKILSVERKYNKKVPIPQVIEELSKYLKEGGWQVQEVAGVERGILQARKGGILQELIASDRALTLTFELQPDGLLVKVGVANWQRNIAIAAIETLLISGLFLLVDVPEILWNKHIEEEVLKVLDQIIEKAPPAN
ncbi:MAG TPA: hypothetical protein ENO36_03270 [Fervidicoccus fontis]|uniref:Uncharacterized protein n=1 Tax=Fervidicoccus fontis TaxID=683846 RepID=A0A7C2YDS7_9CREN|nr:MAG: hypothetical protein C0179_05935 [Fervidicoccus sp.]HEU97859.1 hypothetical protein [Fervidicoccus fontis]